MYTKRSLWTMLLGLAVFCACSSEESGVGKASVELHWNLPGQNPALRGILSGIVDTIRVTVSFEGKQMMQKDFDYEENQGTLTNIPVGLRRTFFVEAFDATTVVYHGTAANITITKGQTTNVPVEMTQAYTDDIYPPAAVTDLSAATQNGNVTLTWTATGNDARAGLAASYDLRRSEDEITGQNFSQATRVVGTPTPAAAGQQEQHVVTGLALGGTYHFAIKVLDLAGNSSGMSNEAEVVLEAPDTTAPNAVVLTIEGVAQDSITLTWVAPGDDANVGTVAQYDVKVSTSPITENNFDQALSKPGPATPLAAGQTERLVVSGLTAGQLYYFAVKAADEVPNWSRMSNVVQDTAEDLVAPAKVTDVGSPNTADDSVDLTWTATGDDGTSGTADHYVLYYAPFTILDDESNLNLATEAQNEPAPQVAGSNEQFTVTGLTFNQRYTFALKVYDEAGNASPLSNVTAATPGQQDVTVPANIANLLATGATETQVSLSWTAPGDDGMTGTVHHYLVRRSENPITNRTEFDAADAVSGPSTLVSATNTQTLDVPCPAKETLYYFGLIAVDDSGNESNMATISGSTVDTTPPGKTTNLAVVFASTTNTSVTLTWPAPGDDGLTIGVATHYEIYYAAAPAVIASDGSNLASATLWTGSAALVPKTHGTTETVQVTGLTADKHYTFAFIAIDHANNRSLISNVVAEWTDITNPDAIVGLAVTNASTTETSVTINWLAPGDDGTSEAATQYEIYYKAGAPDILPDGSNLGAATLFQNPPTPGDKDAPQNVTIDLLTVNTRYTFAILSVDEAGNKSDLSNVVWEITDITKPDAIVLSVSAYDNASVTLSWNAPADGTNTAPVASYTIRYLESGTIDAGSFNGSSPFTFAGAPKVAGQPETIQVTGLNANTPYTFAIKSTDARGNVSDISNVVSQTTDP
jgi:hypothetical protein